MEEEQSYFINMESISSLNKRDIVSEDESKDIDCTSTGDLSVAAEEGPENTEEQEESRKPCMCKDGDTGKKGVSRIRSSEDAALIFRRILSTLDHEECWVAMLDEDWHCTQIVNIATGSAKYCIFDIRKIVKSALLADAAGIILAHNHPSGNARPSKNDVDLTLKLKETLGIFEISIIDHLILSADSYFTFSEESARPYPSV